MFAASSMSVDRLVRSLAENFEARVDSPFIKSRKMNFLPHVERRTKLHSISEKIRDFAVKESLDLSDEKTVRNFIERHTNVFDRFYYANCVPLLTCHLKSINKKITQRVLAKGCFVKLPRKAEEKARNKNGSHRNFCTSSSFKENSAILNHCEYSKQRRMTLLRNSKVPYHNSTSVRHEKIMELLRSKQSNTRRGKVDLSQTEKKKCQTRYNLISSIAQCARKEIEMAEKFLGLSIKDVEFIQQNVHVTLYISIQEFNQNNRTPYGAKHGHVALLCRRAMLCLIEPSKKAFVSFQENLPVVVRRQLHQGCAYQFDSQRSSEESYSALLLLNHWAKILLRQPGTTVLHAISAILGCSPDRVLVLSCPEKLSRPTQLTL